MQGGAGHPAPFLSGSKRGLMNTILTIVVAAGSGSRMNAEIPKQFLLLGGEPIVMRTLRNVAAAVECYLQRKESVNVGNSHFVNNAVHKLVVVLPQNCRGKWEAWCNTYDFHLPHQAIEGGDTRFQSVKNGLEAVPDADIVLVHDGVRPFVPEALIGRVIDGVRQAGAAVPVVPVVDSLRLLRPKGNEAVDRSLYRAVQTPQGFRGDWIRQAYAAPFRDSFTDDATVVEQVTGRPVLLVEGDPANFKITTPDDLKRAGLYI